jgi:hypothetical protein
MRSIEREFYHSARGPRPSDAESWRLVFDCDAGTLLVRHEWNSGRHAGVDEFGIGEFLTQDGGPQNALLALLFGEATANGTGA